MYKMVVSDFFGTLINEEEAISLSTMIEIDRIRNKGILFCITTSKSARVVIEYNRDFPFIDYIVSYNGSYVYDVKKNKALYNKGLGVKDIKKIANLFRDRNLCFYTLDYCNYVGEYKDKDFSIELDRNVLDEFINDNKKNIYKIKICVKTNNEAKLVIKKIKDENLKVSCYLKEDSNYFVIEITNGINSKLTGVMCILDKLKLNMKDVLAVCASLSSLDLIKKCGFGCVTNNSDDKLKKVAKVVTGSNEEKGVEQAIKKYI